VMYTRIINPVVDAFEYETGKFLGQARFELTPEAEKGLLGWVNYRIPIKPFIVLNSDFEPSDNYVPIIPNQTYHQKGIFRALFVQEDTGIKIPIEMRGTYDWRARSVEAGTFIRSADYSNILMDPSQQVLY